MTEETRNPIYDGQYEGESQAQADARRHWARVGMQLALKGGVVLPDIILQALSNAQALAPCPLYQEAIDEVARLNSSPVGGGEPYPHGHPLHKEVFLALSSYNWSDSFEDGVRALIAELKEVRALIVRVKDNPHHFLHGSTGHASLCGLLPEQVTTSANDVPPIPEGMALVPIEPTPRMVDGTWEHEIDKCGGIESQNTRNMRIYRAMLAAGVIEGVCKI